MAIIVKHNETGKHLAVIGTALEYSTSNTE